MAKYRRSLLLFIVMFLIIRVLKFRSQKPPKEFYFDKIFNDEDIINRAFEQLPKCSSNDTIRQRTLLRTLFAWSHFAQIHHIQYWISYGTLVGYVQRGSLLPHDYDLDVTIKATDMKQLLPLAKTRFSSIFKFKVHPQWHIPHRKNRSFFWRRGIDFCSPNARLQHIKPRRYVDVWAGYDYYPGKSRNSKENIETITQYNPSFKWLSIPKSWIFPTKPCKLSGIDVWCPAMPEKIVTILYGLESVNKSDTSCIDGKWTRLNRKPVSNSQNKTIKTT